MYISKTAENTEQAAHVHWSMVRNYTARPKMLFDKDSMIKRHFNIQADLRVSPLFLNQGRMHKQWGLISIYLCNMWSVIIDSQIILKTKSNKNDANKIPLPHVNAFMTEKEITDS